MGKTQAFFGEPSILWGYHKDIMGYENDLRDVLVDFVWTWGVPVPPQFMVNFDREHYFLNERFH